MTKAEIKFEIQKVLDNVPDQILEDLLVMLKRLQDEASDHVDILNSMNRILLEDKELLEKLAKWLMLKRH